MHSADTNTDLQRGTVSTGTDGSLTIAARDGDFELRLDSVGADQLRDTLRALLVQTVRLFENPPNKSHLTLGGETICHYAARAPPSQTPHGVLLGTTDATFADWAKLSRSVTLDPKQAAVPLAVWNGRLPQTDVCQYCRATAVGLGLLPDQDLTEAVPGTQTPPCPDCETPLQLHEKHNGYVFYRHENEPPNDTPPECSLSGNWNGLETDLSDGKVTELTKLRLGLGGCSFADPEPDSISFPTVLDTERATLRWLEEPDIQTQMQLATDDDNKNIPCSTLVLETDTMEIALLFPDLETILANGDEPDTVPPTIPPECEVLPETDILAAESTSDSNRALDGGADVARPTAAAETPAVAPLQLAPPETPAMYGEDCVAAFAAHYGGEDGVRDGVVEYQSTPTTLPTWPHQKPPSRHFHQRILEPTSDEIQPLLSRLDIPANGIHHLVFGGFSGEFAEALVGPDTTVTFTDPMEVWCEAAIERGTYDAVQQCSLGTVPAQTLLDADTAISFECFHGVEGVSNHTLFNLLKGSATPHGLILVVSDQTHRQMDSENRSKIPQLKSKWSLLEEIYDLETAWAYSDEYRVWNLRPTTDRPLSKRRAVDLITIRRLAELGLAAETGESLADTVANEIVSPYPDTGTIDSNPLSLGDNYDNLLAAHPLCEDRTALAESLGRLGTIFTTQIDMDSTLPRNRILIGKYTFHTDGPEQKLIRQL